MKDSNFLKENNARHLRHPMAHPADSLNKPPTIVTGAEGVRITDIDGHETSTRLADCGMSIWAFLSAGERCDYDSIGTIALLRHFSWHLQ